MAQHDSHEFMIYLLEAIQDEQTPLKGLKFDGTNAKKPLEIVCREYYQANPSIISKLFSGIIQTVVTCGKCNYESLTCNPLITMSISPASELEACIQNHLASDKIDGTYTCERCKRESKAKVSSNLIKLPRYLVFHIKRFDASFKKISKTVRYPAKLDMIT